MIVVCRSRRGYCGPRHVLIDGRPRSRSQRSSYETTVAQPFTVLLVMAASIVSPAGLPSAVATNTFVTNRWACAIRTAVVPLTLSSSGVRRSYEGLEDAEPAPDRGGHGLGRSNRRSPTSTGTCWRNMPMPYPDMTVQRNTRAFRRASPKFAEAGTRLLSGPPRVRPPACCSTLNRAHESGCLLELAHRRILIRCCPA